MDFIQPNKRMINWGAILSGICLIAICFSIALCSLNDSSQTEGQITAMRYQENAVAANELLTHAVLIGLSECTDAESIKLEDNLCKMFGVRVVISEQAHTIELTEECTSTEFH